MSALEVAGFGVLWFVFMILAALLVLLYRQVEKAYQAAEGDDKGALLPGVEVPDIEIIGEAGIAPLELRNHHEQMILAITSASCDACETLVRTLTDDRLFSGRRVVVIEGDAPAGHWGAPSNVEIWALAHPPDIIRQFGVTSVPLAYVLSAGVVEAVAVASERDEVLALLSEAADRRNGHDAGREVIARIDGALVG
jgi:hypothetical protein